MMHFDDVITVLLKKNINVNILGYWLLYACINKFPQQLLKMFTDCIIVFHYEQFVS